MVKYKDKWKVGVDACIHVYVKGWRDFVRKRFRLGITEREDRSGVW